MRDLKASGAKAEASALEITPDESLHGEDDGDDDDDEEDSGGEENDDDEEGEEEDVLQCSMSCSYGEFLLFMG